MGQRISVYVYANDPILQAGVGSQLRGSPEVVVVDQAELDQADVAIVVTDLVDETVLRILRAIQRGSAPRTVLIAAVWTSRPSSPPPRPGCPACSAAARSPPSGSLEVVGKVAGRRGRGARPTCSAGCSTRSGSCSGRSCPRAGCVSPGCRAGRSRCCGWSPTGWTPTRSPAAVVLASAPSRTSCTTSRRPAAPRCAAAARHARAALRGPRGPPDRLTW